MIFSVHHLFGHFFSLFFFHFYFRLHFSFGSVKLHNCHVRPATRVFGSFLFIWIYWRARARAAPHHVHLWLVQLSHRPMISKIWFFFINFGIFHFFFLRLALAGPLIDLCSIVKHILNWIVYVYDGHRKKKKPESSVCTMRSRCVRHSSRTRLKTDLFTYLARSGEIYFRRSEMNIEHTDTHNCPAVPFTQAKCWIDIDRNCSRNCSCRSSSSYPHRLTDEMKSSHANEIEVRERKAKRMNSIAWFDRCFDEMDSCSEKNESNDCWLVGWKKCNESQWIAALRFEMVFGAQLPPSDCSIV